MNYEENGVKSFAYEKKVITLDDWYVDSINIDKKPTQEEFEAQKNFTRRLNELLSNNTRFSAVVPNELIVFRGIVYNNPKFEDESPIRTSFVSEFGKDDLYSPTHPFFYFVTTSGTRYYCNVRSKGALQLILETKI